MTYQSVQDLSIEYKLKEALHSIRSLWYQLTEGLAAVPESAEKIRSFHSYFEKELPDGWMLSVDELGNINAYTSFPHKFSQMLIYKTRSGKEFIKILA